jgi:hypothetical protein
LTSLYTPLLTLNAIVGNEKPSLHEQTASGDFQNPRHTKGEGKRDQSHDGDNTHSGTGMEYVSRKTHSSHNPGE